MTTDLPHRLARTCATAALLGVAALALGAARADAATYHAYLCRVPYGPAAGTPAPADNVTFSHTGTYSYASQSCAGGGPMMAAMDGTIAHPFGDGAAATFTAPAGLTIAGFRLWRHMAVGPVAPFGAPVTNLSYTGAESVEGLCAQSLGCTVRGTPAVPLAAENEVAVPNLSGVRQVKWDATCGGAPNQNPCPATGPGTLSAVYNVFAADMLLNDPAPPAVSGVTGPLLAGGTLAGAQSVSFTATDGGSGVHTGTILVDGAAAVQRVLDPSGGACADLGVSADQRPAYVHTQPCPATLSGLLTLDTDALAPGAHALAVTVSDAAGNSAVVGTSTITVAGSVPAGTPNGAGASRAAKLTARWTTTRNAARHLGFGTRPTVTGQLADEAGRPIAGAAVEIGVRERSAGAPDQPVATVTTGPGGAFRAQLPSGPSRTVTIRYAAFSGDGQPAAQVRLRALVRAKLSASATPRSPRVGAPLRLSGRLGYLPRRGVDIAIQARDGRVWRTIGTVKTRRDGRFRWTYRFRTRSSAGRTFGFRARVSSAIYPFQAAVSRTVLVRVRR